MPTKRSLHFCALGALALATPTLEGTTGLTNGLPGRVLAAHNRERATFGVPKLNWDPALEASAKGWADHLAATGTFAHALEKQNDPEGENIWAGSRGRYSAEAMVDGWVREKRNFKQGVFPNNSVTGRTADIGHYTQLMWRDTRRIGCALATGTREDILVCRYSAAGNYVGERPF